MFTGLLSAERTMEMKHRQNVADQLKRIIHAANGVDTAPAYEALQRFEGAPWREDVWAMVNVGSQRVEFEPRPHISAVATKTESLSRLTEILDAYCEMVR